LATTGMNNTTTKLVETTTSYKDALTQPNWQNRESGLNNATNPRFRARKGVKLRQVVIDIDQMWCMVAHCSDMQDLSQRTILRHLTGHHTTIISSPLLLLLEL
jgi:hypothetical protein